MMVAQGKEVRTTEFWAMAISALLWLADRHYGTSLLDGVNIEAVSEAKAQVLAIAASLRESTGDNSNLLIYAGMLVYVLRKAEKIFTRWRSDGAE